MRLLIVCFAYKPRLTPRAFRWTAMAEYWAQQGYHVDVVCEATTGCLPCETLNGVHVWRVGGGTTEKWAARSKRPDVSVKNKAFANGVDAPQPKINLKNRLQSVLLKFAKSVHGLWKKVYWPDRTCFWYFPALRQAQKLLRRHRYDALITVSHPFTAHLVGLSLHKKYPTLSWLADVGDPFCFLESTPLNNSRLYEKANYKFDGRLFAQSGAITVTTEGTQQQYAALFPANAAKISVVPPLLSTPEISEILPPLWPDDEKIRLAFVGTLYKSIRNPAFLLQLFDQLRQTETSKPLESRFELHFFGNYHDCGECFEPYSHLLENQIFLHGLVSRDRVWQVMQEADVLVNIGNDTEFQLPSKIVEYISTGKPILNLIKSPNDSSKAFLETYNAALSLLEQDEVQQTQVAALQELVVNLPCISEAERQRWISTFGVKSISQAYLSLIQNLKPTVKTR